MTTAENRPETPEVTPPFAMRKFVGTMIRRLGVPMGESLAAQSLALATEQVLFSGETSVDSSLVEVADPNGHFLEVYVPFGIGAYLSERAMSGKIKAGIAPEKPVHAWLWRRGIELQIPSVAMSAAKTLIQLEEIVSTMNIAEQTTVGVCFTGGVLALIDNLRPREKRALEHIAVPAVATLFSVGAFLAAPPSVKPALAGFAVASIGNFLENAAEVFDDNSFSDILGQARESLSTRLKD